MLLDEEGEEEEENEEEEVTFKTSIVMPLNIYKNSNFTLTTRASNDQQVPPAQNHQHQQQQQQIETSQSSPSSASSSASLSHHAEFFLTNYSRAIALVDLCLFEYEHLQFAYSELAAAAFYLSLCQTTRQRRCEKNGRTGCIKSQPSSTSSCCPFALHLVERCTGMRWNDELERCVKWMRPYADVCDEMLTALDAQKRNKQHQQQPCPAVYDDEIDPDNVHNIQTMYNYRDWLVSF